MRKHKRPTPSYNRSSNYKPRSIKHLEDKSKKRLFTSIILIALLSYLFFFQGLPFIIGKLSVVNRGKTSQLLTNTDYVELAPPVFNVPYEATNTATIRIPGYSQPKAKVQIYLNDTLKTTINVSDSGTFQAESLELSQGENYLYGKTVNDKDQTSLKSKSIKIIFTSDKPSMQIDSPEDNKTIQGGDKIVNVKGKTDPSNNVSINGQIVIVSFDGTFSKDLILNEGENTLSITAANSVGNTTTVEKKVTYSP